MTKEGLMATERNWCDLPDELLHIIFSSVLDSRYSIVDVFNIKHVCSSWRCVIAGMKNPKRFRRLVVFPTWSNIHKIVRFLHIEYQSPYTLFKRSLINGRAKKIDTRLIGSHGGWVILLENYIIRIRNLITYYSIPVPKEILDGPTDGLGGENLRAIMSHNPCHHPRFVVAVIHSLYWLPYESTIRLWRHGDTAWRPLERDLGYDSFMDIAFHKYSLYALKSGGVIETWGFEQGLPEKKTVVRLSYVSPSNRSSPVYREARLVLLSSGEIFIVSAPHEFRDVKVTWIVMKVDLEKKICVVLNSLNGGALLYGDTSCLRVSSLDIQHHGWKPNSIYFFDYVLGGRILLKKYSFEDGKTRSMWNRYGAGGNKGFYCCWMDLTTTIYSC